MDEVDDKTRLLPRRERAARRAEDKTVLIGRKELPAAEADDGGTRLFSPHRAKVSDGGHRRSIESENSSANSSDNPVVGWLVVAAGPGQGRSLELGYGVNSIGRASDERVSLSFGDEQISRKGHAMLTYDPRGRKFFIQQGSGTNLTYVGDEPVLQPMELKGQEMIGIGNTQLVFVPFCGPVFDWQDQ